MITFEATFCIKGFYRFDGVFRFTKTVRKQKYGRCEPRKEESSVCCHRSKIFAGANVTTDDER